MQNFQQDLTIKKQDRETVSAQRQRSPVICLRREEVPFMNSKRGVIFHDELPIFCPVK